MTAPCGCGAYHSITDTDPGCRYECHPECGPELRGDGVSGALALSPCGVTLEIQNGPQQSASTLDRGPDPLRSDRKGLPDMVVVQKRSGAIAALEHLPSTLREVRRIRGLSLREVAAQAGLAHPTISRMEQGADSSTSTALAVMRWIEGA